MAKLFRALRTRRFALLWIGQAVSLLGDRIFQVALAWWVLETTGSAVAMGLIFIVSIVPMLIFLLLGGVLVDRWPRVPLMFVSNGVRALVIGVMAWLAVMGQLTLWHVYVISLISGLVEAVFLPAYRATVPDITPTADLPSANSLGSLSGQLSGIVGPALGAILVSLGGTSLAFALNSLSFLVATLCLVPLIRRRVPRKMGEESKETDTPTAMIADLRIGLTAVLDSPWLWITIAIAGISNIAYAGPMEVGLPFLIEQDHNGDVNTLGLFFSLSSVGSILGAVWLGRLDTIRRRGIVMYGAWMTVGVLVALLGLPIPLFGLLMIALVLGICNTIVGLVWENTLQELVPGHLLGRVASLDYLGSYILLPIGYGIGGIGIDMLGASTFFVIGGLLHASLIALGLMNTHVRQLD
jgi:MFS family permease